ncbi:TPA: nucleotide pyrophosphohydrolase, partial [Listeria monocytogenes]|nr:nucleotide pyrophosphohydrolase [Listeria monocytogenes]
DVLWYVSQIAKWADISMETVAELNIEKLKRRYPQGFSTERSKLHID